MISRRSFLTTVATGVGVAAVRPRFAWAASVPEVKSSLGGPIGVQLYSLRKFLPQDVPGTLERLRNLGIREVETAGLPAGMTVEAFRAALDKADLVCRSGHFGLERIGDKAGAAIAELKALGGTFLVCPWVKSRERNAAFTREDALKVAEVFNATGKAAKAEGVRFAYHCHGYEFVPSDEGTLFDTLAKNTDPSLVGFEIDIFWAKAGGVDPAKLIASYPTRFPLMHIKDMKKGLDLPAASSGAPEDSDVAAGAGQLDLPAILGAAKKAHTEIYFIEDESTKPWEQIPETLKYLSSLSV